jgi:rRNA maturation endonuclease Nob1
MSFDANNNPEETGYGARSDISIQGEPRWWQRCNVCGKSSESSICPTCADRIRAEAVARKKREDKGEE